MGSKKKNKNQTQKEQPTQPYNCSVPARNLPKSDLGAVIFGCKGHTIDECFSKLLFGLPFGHFAYVKKVSPGLPLFLFNYSDRKLLGIFEAAGPGKLNIDPYAWTNGTDHETEFPAQVKIKTFKRCYALKEDQFYPVIADNYYDQTQPNYFWFEMDHSQTAKMINLFLSSSLPYARPYHHHKPTSDASCSIPNIYNAPLPYGGKPHNAPTSEALPQNDAHASSEQKTWSSLFKYDTSSDMVNKYELLKIASSRPTSPLSEHYNGGEWESCTSPSITKSELHEVCEEEIEGDKESIHPFIEASGAYSGEWEVEEVEGDADNIQAQEIEGDKESIHPFIEAPGAYSGEWKVEEVGADADNIQAPEYSVDGSSSTKLNGICAEDSDERYEEPFVEAPDILSMLMQEVHILKERQMKQEEKIQTLEKELVQSRDELQKLRNQHHALEATPLPSSQQFEGYYCGTPNSSDKMDSHVLVVGGFDGSNWLPFISSYSVLNDRMESLTKMTFSRTYCSVVNLNSEVYVFGGMYGEVWYDTVEAYNPGSNEWCKRPSLNRKKGSLAGASLHGKIFAIGGGNGVHCFSEVEMLDLNIGKWLHSKSMIEKRFATAAAEIKGALYAVGGYDGNAYLKSAERFDPREHTWSKLGDMKARRGCHSLVAYNEKLYALGGYDGNRLVPSVEVFEPRVGSWTVVDQMKHCRGNFGAVDIGGKIYVLGGLTNGEDVLDTVECYDGYEWKITNLRGVGKLSFFSSLVL
ncbi:unnamed protein product [Cuscuta epithymum]|uniref:DCD domain-containing protein n=1 Tax=Cuscuta epithymum TaxID=186058 RepID=A0AAV0DLG0_9ASTE|nr:unnamed protein product [Cuscuta epithymum]